ncbi:MAG: glycoside hydrolase family 31 protein [Bacteroidota bacterium]|nr:glycoside hydrolase family 31 protein [Bacteroidota bacterium]
MMRYLISLLLTCVFLSVSYGQNNLTLRWEKVAPGIWKTTIGALEQIDLLRAAGAKPRMNELSALGENGPNFDFKQIEAERFDGKTILRFPLLEDEKIYGLGLNFKTVNQRGKIKELHVDHFGGDDNGRTHAPVPFFVSDKGYGVFLNSSRYIKISVGCIVRRDAKRLPPVIDRNVGENWDANPPSDVLEAAIPGSGMEVYIFEGPDMLKVVQRFNLFCGGGFIPPKWGLGFSYRFPTLSSDKNVVSEIEQFQKHNFPLSVIGLEPGWQSMSYPCTFEWDKNRFPNPVKFVNEMTEKGIHVNLWLNPYISPKSSCYEKLKQLSGSHLVWNGIVPDYSLSKAQDIFKNFLKKEHVDLGISGYKMDEVDGF